MEIIIKTIILGIVEGMTEFLPISSTGHLIIVANFLDYKSLVNQNFENVFNVVIQLGAIIAILVLYSQKITKTLKNFTKNGYKFWIMIFIGFIPSAILGLLINDFMEKYLMNVLSVSAALFLGGIAMIIIESKLKKVNNIKNVDEISYAKSFKIGFFQCFSLWPGMSRSASTIIGGWINGLDSVTAAEYSFFLALPTMVSASAYKLFKATKEGKVEFSSQEVLVLGIGTAVSFLVALFVVEKFVNYLKKKPMKVFGYYRIGLAIVLLILVFTGLVKM